MLALATNNDSFCCDIKLCFLYLWKSYISKLQEQIPILNQLFLHTRHHCRANTTYSLNITRKNSYHEANNQMHVDGRIIVRSSLLHRYTTVENRSNV